MQTAQLQLLVGNLLIAVGYLILVNIVDSLFVNPMYPIMVQQYYQNGTTNFRSACLRVFKRLKTIFVALLIVSLIFASILVPFVFLIIYSIKIQNQFLFQCLALAFICVAFFVLVITYLFYPIGTLEKTTPASLVEKTFRLSLKYKGDVIKAILISLFISAISLFLTLILELMRFSSPLLSILLIFSGVILTRVLVAIFVTYQYVLNAVFYLGFEKGVFFSDKK